MERPWYQRTTAYIGYAVIGFTVLGSLLSAYANARRVVTPQVTIVGSAIVTLTMLGVVLFLRRKRRIWILKSGLQVFPKDLGVKAYLVSLGFLLLLWIPRVAERWAPGDFTSPSVGLYLSYAQLRLAV